MYGFAILSEELAQPLSASASPYTSYGAAKLRAEVSVMDVRLVYVPSGAPNTVLAPYDESGSLLQRLDRASFQGQR